jgi:hypothetical protein
MDGEQGKGGGGASEGKGVSGGKRGAEACHSEWPCACACMLCAEPCSAIPRLQVCVSVGHSTGLLPVLPDITSLLPRFSFRNDSNLSASWKRGHEISPISPHETFAAASKNEDHNMCHECHINIS